MPLPVLRRRRRRHSLLLLLFVLLLHQFDFAPCDLASNTYYDLLNRNHFICVVFLIYLQFHFVLDFRLLHTASVYDFFISNPKKS